MKKLYLILFPIIIILVAVYFFWNKNNKVNKTTYQDYIKAAQATAAPTLTPFARSGWIAWWNDGQALATIQNNPHTFNELLPVWYKLQENGKITEISAIKNKQSIKEFALENNISLIPSITNDFDPARVSKILDDENLQQEIINDLVFKAQFEGYKGWDIDWEEVYPGDNNGFADFVSNLADNLHEKNLTLSITVQAKTGSVNDNPSAVAQDWKRLSEKADVVRIMAYDIHNENSEAGAVTPLDAYTAILQNAVKDIPISKINIALPTYGYDWIGAKGEPLQYDELTTRAQKNNVTPTRDEASAALVYRYKNNGNHEVWFEDKISAETKILMARSFGINSFTFWRLGGEDPQIWEIK